MCQGAGRYTGRRPGNRVHLVTGLRERNTAQPPVPEHSGEDTAIAEVYAAHREELRLYLLACRFDAAEIEDAIQDSIKAVRDAVLRGREIANLKAYWYRSAVLRAGRLSKERAARMMPTTVLANAQAAGDGDDPLLAIPDPVDHVDGRTSRLYLLSVIRRLPRRQAQVLWLSVVEDFAEADTAEILNIKVGTVKSTLSAAKKNLADLFRGNTRKGEVA
jgi:RNA polymerase sigma-70 factor (ECF subfamily)